jgi:methyl-accepting chemotaxis protein
VGIITVAVILPYTLNLFNRFIVERYSKELGVCLNIADLILENMKKEIDSFANFLSKENAIKVATQLGIGPQLIEYLRNKLRPGYIDMIIITDNHGVVLARASSNKNGDDLSNNELIKTALSSKPSSGLMVFSAEELAKENIKSPYDKVIVIVSVFPITSLEGTSLVGTILAGDIVNNNSYLVEEMQKRILLSFAILQDNFIITTNLKDKKNDKPLTGVKLDLNTKKVNKQKQSITLGGENYFIDYLPLKNVENSDIGFLMVGIDTSEVNTMKKNTLLVMLFISLIVLGAAFIFSLVLSPSISKPISQMGSLLEMLAERGGDLTKRLDIATKDEIGGLAQWFNKFISALHNMVSQVRSTAEKVSSFSQELSSSAQQMNATTTQISATIQQVSKGVTGQASKIETTHRVMEEMADSVKRVSSNVQVAATASEKATNTARKGGDLARQAVEKMIRINEVIGSLAKGVNRLTGRSQQISEIVNILTSITDQTNLLALNAAIEAARAGEAGRGFAVVAEEVRKLAEDSARSAKDIGKLVSEIQNETVEAANSMVAGTKEISEGTKIVNEVGKALEEIVQEAQKVSQVVSQVASSSIQQLEGTKNVVTSIDEVASIAKESSSAAQQVSASTEEQISSMQELTSNSQELARLASDLKELVSKFKLE